MNKNNSKRIHNRGRRNAPINAILPLIKFYVPWQVPPGDGATNLGTQLSSERGSTTPQKGS